LLAELGALLTADQLAEWAPHILQLKNTMTNEDASTIEQAFRSKMTAIEPELTCSEHRSSQNESETADPNRSLPAQDETVLRKKQGNRAKAARNNRRLSHHVAESALPSPAGKAVQGMAVDKSVLTLNEPRRYRNRAHLELVASQPCLICERRPSDAHHLRFAQPSALGRRVSDEFTVPLCRVHHRALHRRGNEADWWAEHNLEPTGIAQRLWSRTRLGPNKIDNSPLPIPGIDE
jgi:hypothetical protein